MEPYRTNITRPATTLPFVRRGLFDEEQAQGMLQWPTNVSPKTVLSPLSLTAPAWKAHASSGNRDRSETLALGARDLSTSDGPQVPVEPVEDLFHDLLSFRRHVSGLEHQVPLIGSRRA